MVDNKVSMHLRHTCSAAEDLYRCALQLSGSDQKIHQHLQHLHQLPAHPPTW